MKKIFITYGDKSFEESKIRIISEAERVKQFDNIISYGRDKLSSELLSTEIINIKRGGGLWSWKPDIILTTINNANIGDIIVYCDAGCSLHISREWRNYWSKLKNHDILAQRIFQQTDKWTRKNIIEYYSDNGKYWLSSYQYLATVVILKITEFSRQFVREWRDIMVKYPEFAMDVSKENIHDEYPRFIENRHDQAIYSAIIYKYLRNPETRNKIFTQWEHIENYDFFSQQAIRASRLRNNQNELLRELIIGGFKRLVRNITSKPFYFIPKQKFIEMKMYKTP